MILPNVGMIEIQMISSQNDCASRLPTFSSGKSASLQWFQNFCSISVAVAAGPNPFAGTVEIEFQAEEAAASTAFNVLRPFVKSCSVVEFVNGRVRE